MLVQSLWIYTGLYSKSIVYLVDLLAILLFGHGILAFFNFVQLSEVNEPNGEASQPYNSLG